MDFIKKVFAGIKKDWTTLIRFVFITFIALVVPVDTLLLHWQEEEGERVYYIIVTTIMWIIPWCVYTACQIGAWYRGDTKLRN